MKKSLICHALLLVIAINSFSLQALAVNQPASAPQENRTLLQKFQEKISSTVRISRDNARFLFNWGMKKYNKQETTASEDKRAYRMLKKIGLTLGALLVIIGGLVGFKMYRDKLAKDAQEKEDQKKKAESEQKQKEDDKIQQTAEHIASEIMQNKKTIFDIFNDEFTKNSPAIILPIFKSLIDNKYNFSHSIEEGQATVIGLMRSNAPNKLGLITLLLEKGNIDLKQPNDGAYVSYGNGVFGPRVDMTAIKEAMYNIEGDNPHLIQLLINRGANINLRGNRYNIDTGENFLTPLEMAFRKKLTKTADLLIENGANLEDELKDGMKDTILDHSNMPFTEFLINKVKNKKDAHGQRIVDVMLINLAKDSQNYMQQYSDNGKKGIIALYQKLLAAGAHASYTTKGNTAVKLDATGYLAKRQAMEKAFLNKIAEESQVEVSDPNNPGEKIKIHAIPPEVQERIWDFIKEN